MQVRSIGELKSAQSRMLTAYKTERHTSAAEVDQQGDAENVNPDIGIGRVDQVVTSDATFGPHLKIALQHFSGAPPVATDASTTLQVFYPSPGKSVNDYAVNERVGLMTASGVRWALKL